SYTEWQQQLDKILTAEQRAAIAKGTPRDWFEESHKAAQELYIASPKGQKLWYQYANYSAPIVEKRLLAGGLRLAMLLNEIYGN
ncbi:MAG: S1/P1 Nuclease, partial [Alistipes sp.]|nr:S1/P1 Nuclease [Alistipes sp.]